MGLLDLKTDLKSLKYGKDRPGGGDSRQPFIKSTIPEENSAQSPDFLLRNGFLNPVNSVKDSLRISKFLTTIDGVLFVAKQEALALTNPVSIGGRTATGFSSVLYNPLNTIAQVAGNSIGFHSERTGAYPDITNYTQKYDYLQKNEYAGNKNRLQLLFEAKIKDQRTSDFDESTAKQLGIDSSRDKLFSYIGGPNPNALIGGKTNFLRVTYTDENSNPSTGNPRPTQFNQFAPLVKGVSGKYGAYAESNLLYLVDKQVNEQGQLLFSPNIYVEGTLNPDEEQLKLKANSKQYVYISYDQAVGATLKYDEIKESSIFANTFNADGLLTFNNKVYEPGTLNVNQQVVTPSPSKNLPLDYNNTLGVSKKFEEINPDSLNLNNTISDDGSLLFSPKITKPDSLELDPSANNAKKVGPYTFNGNDLDKLNLSNLYKTKANDPEFKTNDDLGLNGNNKAVPNNNVYTSFPSVDKNVTEGFRYGSPRTFTQTQIINKTPIRRGGTGYSLQGITDYRDIINGFTQIEGTESEAAAGGQLIPSTDYTEFNREKTYLAGSPGFRAPKRIDYNIGPQDILDNPLTTGQDKINLYDSSAQNSEIEEGDLIKFNFRIINNDSLQDEYLYFRAYLDSFSDSFSSDWNSYKYVGRAENLYSYKGFERSISLGFTVAAQSRAELLPIYKKLNRLIGATAPDYSGAGIMRGSVVKLTVGDYLISTPGIIKGFSIEPILDAGWEIARDFKGRPITNKSDIQQLPKAFKVNSINFLPIHNFIPEKGASFVGAML